MIFTQLSIIEVRNLFRQEIEGYFLSNPITKNSPKSVNYLTRAQVADKYHITLPTLHAWTMEGILKAYRIGRRVLYKEFEVDQALSAIITTSTK